MPKAPKTQSSPRATGTQRPFKCNCCDQRFERKAELTRHEVLHSENVNDHKLECTYTGCGYRTLQKSNLKTHINAVHLKLKKHKCRSEGCQSAFGDPASRVRHEKSQHGIGRTDQSKRTREATVEYTVETPSVPVIALPALYTFSDSESSTGGSSQSEGSSTRGSSPGSSLSPITPTYPLLSLPSAAGPSCPTDADYTDAELTLNYGDPNLYPPFDPSLCQFGAQTTVNQQAWFPATGFSIPTIPPSCFSLDYSSSYSGYISSEVTQEFTVPELPPAGFSFSFPPPTSEIRSQPNRRLQFP
ncbi:hypothetical protein BD410DRAFT_792629 [Rickenella mellea]|uniref:C2H2-type domain-containing protein n=1 Tax=Rickenella mellea TaxID=50990 RepID=A0A4Y7PVE8_9AGAM|nr:hypothetical protein BD410DRAFT_792629 [Rickenella mellea]